jgi:uncharacterized membrane protein YfcA
MEFDLLIFGITFIAAFLFSLGGIGAAIILIPILVSLGIPVNTAKPVGLFNNIVSMTGASISNIKNKRLNFRLGIPIIFFSFVFAVLGAYLSKFISARTVLFIFTAFLLFSGLMFLFHKKNDNEEYRNDTPYLPLSLIGAVAGLLSGLLGIGGGGIISPLMLMLGFNPKKTAAVTAFVVPFSSLAGFITYWAMGTVDWHLLAVATTAGVLGATAGTVFMQKKLNPGTVKKILAVILLLMAAKLLITNIF